MRCIALLASVLAAGCASAPRAHDDVVASTPRAESRPAPAADDPQALYDDHGRPLVSSTISYTNEPTEDRWATRSLHPAPTPAPARPARVGKRDILLKQARLDNALRWLAREGKYNVVVEGDLATPVTVELRNVEPYDAAMALAEAHDLLVRYAHGIMIIARDAKP